MKEAGTAEKVYQYEGIDIPTGLYLVKLIHIEMKSFKEYKLKVEIMKKIGKENSSVVGKVIEGCCERYASIENDLYNVFHEELVLSKAKYLGEWGLVELDATGWMTLYPRYFAKVFLK